MNIRYFCNQHLENRFNMKKKIPIILLNFTGVYELEAFASNKNIIHVDCRDMKGVD